MMDGSWLIVGQHKTKEEEQWFPFLGDKNAHVAQRATIRHYGKGVTLVKEPFTLVKEPFEMKKDLEDDYCH
jgi:hypothetical protein